MSDNDTNQEPDAEGMEEMPETEALPLSIRRARAAFRKEDPDSVAENGALSITVSNVFPMSTTAYQEELAAEARRRAAEAARREEEERERQKQFNRQQTQQAWERQRSSKSSKIGDNVYGKGVYAGLHEVKDENGESLGWYDVYTTPEDLPKYRDGIMSKMHIGKKTRLRDTFNNVAEIVSQLDNYHSFRGSSYDNETLFFSALKLDQYAGEWIIPTKEILVEVLHKNKYRFGFVDKKTPEESAYWSMSRHDVNGLKQENRATVSMSSDDNLVYHGPDNSKFLTRLVRLEKATLEEKPGNTATPQQLTMPGII